MRAIVAVPANNATFAHVVNQMLTICAADGKPVQYRSFIRNRFTIREVVVSLTPLTLDFAGEAALAPVEHESCKKTPQNRGGCCGTMLHSDFNGDSESLEADIEEFRKSLQAMGSGSGRSKSLAVGASNEAPAKAAP